MSNEVMVLYFYNDMQVFEEPLKFVEIIQVQETKIEVYLHKRTNKRVYFVEGEQIEINGEKYTKMIPLNKEEFQKFNISETFEETYNYVLIGGCENE